MPKPKNPISISGAHYAIAADEKSESAEIKMYGEVVEKRPTDWWTGKPIDGDFIISSEFIKDVEKLGKCKKLNIRLNSIGGEVHAAILIHNRLREMSRNGTEITCSVDGIAMSAGSMIMCAADHVSVSAESLVMIHKSIVCICSWLNADTLRELAERSDSYDKVIAAAYKRKTGLDENALLAMMSETTYLTGEEAKEKGFADEVFESETKIEVAACADKSALMINGKKFSLYGMPCPENIPVISERPAPPDINTNNNGGKLTMAKDLSELIKENPELAAKVQDELTAKISAEITAKASESTATQIAAERKRLEEIDKVAHLFDEETIAAAKYGDKACTAQEMCYRAAQKAAASGTTFMANVKTDAEQSGVTNVTSASGTPDVTANGEADIKAFGLSFMDSVLNPRKETV